MNPDINPEQCETCPMHNAANLMKLGLDMQGWDFVIALAGNPNTGMRLSLFYIISPPVFLISGIFIGAFLDVGIWHWVVLGFYVLLNVVSFPVRMKGCGLCAMRMVCPGSAAKPDLENPAGDCRNQ